MCGYEGHADVVGAINVSQGRILPEEPPKRIRKRVGKRKLRSAEAPVMANAEAVQHAA
jgi:hypothetical protein